MKSFLRLIVLAMLCFASRAFCQDANPPIYSELIPTSSGLAYNLATDAQDTFVAPNGKTVEVLVKGPQGTGTYTRAIRKGETADEYFPAVVAEAQKLKMHHLVIPKGTYSFVGPELCTDLKSKECKQSQSCNASQYYNCNPIWTIGTYPQGQVKEPDSVSDLDIDFSGSVLNFNAPVIGIWILESERLRLRNVTIDWPSLPIASVGTIVADPDNHGHNALVIDAKYPVTDRYQGGPVQIQAVDPWDESASNPPGIFDANATNQYEVYFIFGNAPQPTYVGKTSAGAQTFSCKSCNFRNSPTDPTCNFGSGCANFDSFAPGSRVIVRHYTYNGFAVLVNWSNDIDFDNVTLRTGPGMGFALSSNGGYRGFRIGNSEIKRAPGRLISTASDAINLGTGADVLLENNEIAYQGDDSINLHSVTGTVSSARGAQVDVAQVCSPDPMDNPVTGDEIAFFDENFVYKATARVTEAKGTVCGATLTLTMDHAVAGLNSTSNFLDLTQNASARYLIRNNSMHDCRCHGAFVNAPYGSIDHNTMYGNSAGSIQLDAGAGYGPGSTNLAVTSNVASFPGQGSLYNGSIEAFAGDVNGNILSGVSFEKIAITDNVLTDSQGPAILANAMRYFSIAGNTMLDMNEVQAAPEGFGDLTTLDSMALYLSSDGTVCGDELDGPTTGPVGISKSDRSVLFTSDCN